MYTKRGCRCDRCRSAKAAEMRAYYKTRREQGRPLSRGGEQRECEQCSKVFMARVGQKFCSQKCNGASARKAPKPRFRISKAARQAIYEAANWLCQLCESPVRPDEDVTHPRSPTLDHIQPRSLGGSDDPDNLRLACRQCNVLRGANVEWSPLEVMASVSA